LSYLNLMIADEPEAD